MNEAKEGAQQAKWGMVSSQPGDELLLRISRSHKQSSDTEGTLLLGGTEGTPSANLNSSVVVGLGLLRSYRSVGTAVVGCSGGCACKQKRFQLLHMQQVSACHTYADCK